MSHLVTVYTWMNLFLMLDRCIGSRFQQPYVAVHAIQNTMVVLLSSQGSHTESVSICIAFHLCRLLWFQESIFYHIGMLATVVPLGLMGYPLIFLTGLPDAIGNALLFGVANGWINRGTESRIQAFLHVWIRSPGCCAQAFLMCIYALSQQEYVGCIPAFLIYCNSQYFVDYTLSRRDS